MKKSNSKGKIHFIGIGGIGVSALARYYLEKGFFLANFEHKWRNSFTILDGQGNILGFLLADERIRRIGNQNKKNYIYVMRIAVRPGYERRTIGTRLIQYLSLNALARDNAPENVALAVYKSNKNAVAFYEGLDFNKVYETAPVEGDLVYFEKPVGELASNTQSKILEHTINNVAEEHTRRKDTLTTKAREKGKEVVLIKELVPERFRKELDARKRAGLIADDINIVSIEDKGVLEMLTTDSRAQDRTVLLTQGFAERLGLTDDNCKAQRIMLDRYDTVENFSFVYLEGAIALGRAVNAEDRDSIELFYRFLTNRNIADIESVMQAISQRRLRLEVLLPAIEIPQLEEGIRKLRDLEEEEFIRLKAA